MNEKSNGLNLPAIKKNDGLVSKPNKTIVPLNLSKKNYYQCYSKYQC